jgi:hypothetical protein
MDVLNDGLKTPRRRHRAQSDSHPGANDTWTDKTAGPPTRLPPHSIG